MRRLTDRLYPWWEGRTLREQRMLALMMGLIAVVFLWLAVVRPALDWRDHAAADRAQAEADLADVRAGLRLVAPSSVATPRAVIDVEGFEPLVRRTAAAAGLDISTGLGASGEMEFRVPNASSQALFGWLSTLEREHGIAVISLGVVENTDATLQVEGAVSRQSGSNARS